MSCCWFGFLIALFEAKALDIIVNEGDDVVSSECSMFSVLFIQSYGSYLQL